MGHSISRKSHALSSSCNIDHFVVQLILRLRQETRHGAAIVTVELFHCLLRLRLLHLMSERRDQCHRVSVQDVLVCGSGGWVAFFRLTIEEEEE